MRHFILPLIAFLLISCKDQTAGTNTERKKEKAMTPQQAYSSMKNYAEEEDTTNFLHAYRYLESIDSTSAIYDSARALYEKEIVKYRQVSIAQKQALNDLKSRYDKVEDQYWYKNPYFTHYNNKNLLSLYIGQKGKDGSPYLRLKASYHGEDWIFFDEVILSYDGNSRHIDFSSREKETENEAGKVWEWIDVRVDESGQYFLRQLAEAENPVIRLKGKYQETRRLYRNEKRGILKVLDGFEYLDRQ